MPQSRRVAVAVRVTLYYSSFSVNVPPFEVLNSDNPTPMPRQGTRSLYQARFDLGHQAGREVSPPPCVKRVSMSRRATRTNVGPVHVAEERTQSTRDLS